MEPNALLPNGLCGVKREMSGEGRAGLPVATRHFGGLIFQPICEKMEKMVDPGTMP
jgi:hypothetical protein